jgi:hypothetical protein
MIKVNVRDWITEDLYFVPNAWEGILWVGRNDIDEVFGLIANQHERRTAVETEEAALMLATNSATEVALRQTPRDRVVFAIETLPSERPREACQTEWCAARHTFAEKLHAPSNYRSLTLLSHHSGT